MRPGLLAVILALAACSSDGYSGPDPDPGPAPPPPLSATVQATSGSVFQPGNVGIRTGGTVTWAFGSLGHNVTFEDVVGAPGDIPGSNTNTSIARNFPTAGTFPYDCTLHPGMSGTVSVSN